ncbi:Phosducin-like protein 3 [Wickerhamomyces ciferrii]|uniref:Phosducin-like protein 3 n=1 Tax=Wickerhamomyces ciferrii (strain ATCC 14091 / BCRC 22168 / CBS 111 / JCM 3599 / NBRC 0793 / NRRL Y-1031 F-60-10) TaxID=1206466 RepID=K0KHN9_WICCF|nr:Phosducin-like protein 3 [Wickerhamomyces ciferrii]CCH40678.1 Phosducin-like protein 3 [Wickerhamomyces ciferrii]
MDPNMKINMQVDPDEDTEWNDILRKHGVIPERPPSPTEQLEEALQEAVVKQYEHRLDGKDLEELEELEDEEDEEFLEEYKNKRLKELQQLNQVSKFGSVYPITKPEYKTEITDASKENTFVWAHMSLQSSLQSRLLSSLFVTLASKFKEIKFVEIPGSRAVENYPDSNCPTILIYFNGDVVKQYITLTELGGNATTVRDLEKVLVDIKAVKDSDKRLLINQEDEDLEEAHRLRFAKKSIRGRVNDDDDDDDFFD